jgi:hypothetical protein
MIAEIQRKANDAIWGDSRDKFGPRNAQAIIELARLAADVDLPPGKQGRRTEVSDALDSYAYRLPTLEGRSPNDQGEWVDPAAWTPLQDRLQGMVTTINFEDIRAFQTRLRAWLDDYSKMLGIV